jgi:hypothetical protein
MRVGGADGTNRANDPTTPLVDLGSLTAGNTTAPKGEQPGSTLNTPRAHLNTVVLPDGEILAVGGGAGSSSGATEGGAGLYTGPVYQSELWSPGTNTWSPADTQSYSRTYHSIALLLPDGRVLSGGDDGTLGPGTRLNDTLEIYSPPYLFQGARPSLSGAPAAADYGTSVSVQTDTGVKAVLIANGAVTHAFDNDQRSIALTTTPTAGGLSVSIPASANIAPPGYYMLFVLNAQGVPSVAQILRVGPPIATTPPPPGGGGVQPPAGNLTHNFSFETDTSGWSCYQCTLARAVLPDAPAGTAAAQVTLKPGFTSMALDDNPDTIASTVAGTAYVATAYVRAADPSSVGKTVRINLRERTTGGQVVQDVGSGALTLTNACQPVTVTATTKASGDRMDVRVRMSGVAGNAFYADAVSVAPSP